MKNVYEKLKNKDTPKMDLKDIKDKMVKTTSVEAELAEDIVLPSEQVTNFQ